MKGIFMRRLSLSILILALALISPVQAAEEQIYTVKKGDTLWDLSQRFIDDPYYWPNVWSKNPSITNPHLIFPGQKIRILDGRLEIIPAYTQQEASPETSEAAAVAETTKPEESLTIRTEGSGHGFILTDEDPLGLLVDSVDNRVLLTENDTVFVSMRDVSAVNVGDTYGLYARDRQIKNPETGVILGTMMNNLGALQVTAINGATVTAKIVLVYREITRGAELFTFIPPAQEVTLKQGLRSGEGLIVAARDEKNAFATGDLIFINLGTDDRLTTGNLVYLARPRQLSAEYVEQVGEMILPDAVLGAAVTLETSSNWASALIIKSAEEAHIGDKVHVVME